MLNRRELLTGGACALTVLPFLNEYSFAEMFRWDTFVLKPPKHDPVVKPQKAVSLARLLDDAKNNRPAKIGMTRIDGYIAEGNDVILWGRDEPNEEEVSFNDFVVIYRSIMQKYGKGIPSVSLDARDPNSPYPSNSGEAYKAGKIKHAELSKMKYGPERDRICGEVLSWSRVTALMEDSQVAKDLLDADQHMKLVGCGIEKPKIKDPFPSYVDMMMEARARKWSGTASAAELEVMNLSEGNGSGRMWFEPGKMSYIFSENNDSKSYSIFLDCVQVTANDQLSPYPELNKDAEGDNLFWKAFAISYTNRMDELVTSTGRCAVIFASMLSAGFCSPSMNGEDSATWESCMRPTEKRESRCLSTTRQRYAKQSSSSRRMVRPGRGNTLPAEV
jgi:hypothetical protein